MLTIRPAIEMVVLSSRCSFSIESNCLRKLGRSKSTLNLCGYGFNLVSSLSSEAMNFLRFSKYFHGSTASSPPPSFFRFGFFAPCFASLSAFALAFAACLAAFCAAFLLLRCSALDSFSSPPACGAGGASDILGVSCLS